ncbi:MAG: AI-2E family transporter, partial [Campylobacterota bacterium]|nr:AI-2E family transporter [Campylobacterota bacterium]
MNKIINHNNSSVFSTIAFLMVIITGLKLGSSIILPLMMAFFLYIICLPIVNRLDSSKVPNFITSLFIITFVVFLIFILNSFLISSSNEIMKNIPAYQEKFYELIPKVIAFFEQFNISIDKNSIISSIEPSKLVQYITTFFKSMGNIIMYIVLTLALFMFLLFESPLVIKKSRYFTKLDQDNIKFEKFLYSINRYFVLKTFTSIITGVMIYFMLLFFDLEYALLFAVLAFLLNYLPTVGAIVAAFPAIFVAILQLDTIDITLITIGYLLINI